MTEDQDGETTFSPANSSKDHLNAEQLPQSNMKRCSTSLIIREMQIKTIRRYFSPWSEWLLSKCLQIINAGEGVEKREPSYTVGGNANQYSHYGEQCGDSLKNWKQNCHTTQQPHYCAYIPRKPELRYMYPNVHHSTVYNSQDIEETQMSISR